MAHTIVIIGYGGMGGWHARQIKEKIPEMNLKGIWDVREEARQKALENGLYAYSSLNEVLTDPQVDLVTIATPNNFHRDLAIRCMRAGKNVICEKPVTMNAAQLEDIIGVRDETGKLFSVHQNRRWDRDYATVRDIIHSGAIGQPYFIESRVQGSRGALHGWRAYRVDGGGMLLDWGVHLLDQAMNLFDCPVVAVDAHLANVFYHDVDDNIKLTVHFENGVSYLIEVSTNCFIPQPRWHMSCTEGTAVVEDWSCGGRMVRLNTDAAMEWGDDIVYTEAGPTRTMAPRPAETTSVLPLPEVHVDWADYYRNILATLDGQAELIVKPEQALRVMRVIDLLFRSGEVGHGLECRI